jgi:hypothetical protein
MKKKLIIPFFQLLVLFTNSIIPIGGGGSVPPKNTGGSGIITENSLIKNQYIKTTNCKMIYFNQRGSFNLIN